MTLFTTMSKSTIPIPATDEIEFETVLKDVLQDDGTLQESLTHFGANSIYDFLALTLSEIDTLTKPQPSEEPSTGVTTRSSAATQATLSAPIRIPLLLVERSKLKAFKGYIWWYQLENEGAFPTFMLIERSEYDAFRISLNWNPDIPFARPLPTAKPPSYLSVDQQV